MKTILTLVLAVVLSAAGSITFGQQPESKGKQVKEKVEKKAGAQQVKERMNRSEAPADAGKMNTEEVVEEQKMKGKSGQEEAARRREMADQDENQQNEKAKERDGSENKGAEIGKGNAFGRNKGELEGKEFGQARADQARAMKEVMERSDRTLDEAGQKLEDTRKKLEEARKKLELKRASSEISEEEYEATREAIEEIETRTEQIESERSDQERRAREMRERTVLERGAVNDPDDPVSTESTTAGGEEEHVESTGTTGAEASTDDEAPAASAGSDRAPDERLEKISSER